MLVVLITFGSPGTFLIKRNTGAVIKTMSDDKSFLNVSHYELQILVSL